MDCVACFESLTADAPGVASFDALLGLLFIVALAGARWMHRSRLTRAVHRAACGPECPESRESRDDTTGGQGEG